MKNIVFLIVFLGYPSLTGQKHQRTSSANTPLLSASSERLDSQQHLATHTLVTSKRVEKISAYSTKI